MEIAARSASGMAFWAFGLLDSEKGREKPPQPPLPGGNEAGPPGRGCLVWLVGLLFLLSALFGFQRLAAALGAWDTLQELGMQPGPLYAVFSGLVWGLVSLVAGVGLLAGWPWAAGFCRAAVIFLAAFFWIDRLALTRSASAAVSEPFLAIVTAVLGLGTFWVLGRRRK